MSNLGVVLYPLTLVSFGYDLLQEKVVKIEGLGAEVYTRLLRYARRLTSPGFKPV